MKTLKISGWGTKSSLSREVNRVVAPENHKERGEQPSVSHKLVIINWLSKIAILVIIFVSTITLMRAQTSDFWKTGGNWTTGVCNKTQVGTLDSCSLRFITNNLFRATITAAGQFGFGVETPNNMFHIHNPVRIINNSNSSQSSALNSSAFFAPSFRSSSDLDNDTTNYTKDGNYNVLGTTESSKSSILLTNDISGNMANDGLKIESSGESASIHLQESGNLLIQTKNSPSLLLNADKFEIKSDGTSANLTFKSAFGYIGIGETGPTCKLDVYAWRSADTTIARFKHISGNARLEIRSTTNAAKIINNINGNGLILSTLNSNGSENKNQLFLSSNNSVGIGTSNTFGYKLAVGGSIGAKCAFVESLSAWPDFVFSKEYVEYQLMPLKDLELFVRINNRLPNIPSAKEVEENGINLGEMVTRLVQTNEEQVLYIIDLQKQIDGLTTLVEQLQEQINKTKGYRQVNKLLQKIDELLHYINDQQKQIDELRKELQTIKN